MGPNCSFFSGSHPLDPDVRNGTRGPETGKPINVGDDCWLGGNVIVLPGITIGQGSTVGAGSVVTKDVEPYSLVAGNPARFIRKIKVPDGHTDPGSGANVEVLATEDVPKVSAPPAVEGGLLKEVAEYVKRDSAAESED